MSGDSKLMLGYDGAELQAEYVSGLDAFEKLLVSGGAWKLASATTGETLRASIEKARQRMQSPLTLMIIGDFKRGKSTLLNALLGTAAAPVDVRPETISINRLEYAETPSVQLVTTDSRIALLTLEDLKRERLEPLLASLPVALRHIRIGLPIPWLRDLTVVDTPGLGDAFEQFDQTVAEYLEQADVVIHVSSALSPMSQSELAYLSLVVAPRLIPKILFVVNMIDLVPDEASAGRVLHGIREKLHPRFPNAPLFGISALGEWQRLHGEPCSDPARAPEFEAGFGALKRELDDAILVRRQALTLMQAIQIERRGIESFRLQLDAIHQNMELDRTRLQQAVDALQASSQSGPAPDNAGDALAQKVSELERQTLAWMQEFWYRLQASVEAEAPELGAGQLRKHFPFFLADRVKCALETCFAMQQEDLARAAEEARASLRSNTESLLSVPGGAEIAPLKLPWTNLQSIQMIASQFGIGGVIEIGLALIGKGRQNAVTGDLVEAIHREMNNGLPALRDSISALYAGVLRDLREQIASHHREELQTIQANLSQALALREAKDASLAGSRQLIDDVSAALNARLLSLDKLLASISVEDEE